MHRVAHHQLLFMQTENIRLLNFDNPRSFDFKTVMMEFRSVKGQNVTITRRQSRKRYKDLLYSSTLMIANLNEKDKLRFLVYVT